MKAFTANFSDFSGLANPSGLWSPSFLALKLALERGDRPDNVRQCLYDWLSQRHVSPEQVDALLDLEPEKALAALVQKIGGGLRHEPDNPTLPPIVLSTLRRTLVNIAQTYGEKKAAELAQAQQRLDRIKSAFVEGRSPTAVVEALLK